MTLITILCIYTAFYSLISINQILFLKKEKCKQAEILSEKDYEEAANISIENEKFQLFSAFYNLIINIAWISFALSYLKDFFIKENSILENTLFLLAFLFITMLLSLPLGIYKSFIKDKKQGFSNMTVALFIKDSIKSLILVLIFGFLITYALLFCYSFFGSAWWIWAFVFSFLLILLINLIYPTLIAPIFNKMKKLELMV